MPDWCVRGHAASGPIVLLSTGRRLVKSKKKYGRDTEIFGEERKERKRSVERPRYLPHFAVGA